MATKVRVISIKINLYPEKMVSIRYVVNGGAIETIKRWIEFAYSLYLSTIWGMIT